MSNFLSAHMLFVQSARSVETGLRSAAETETRGRDAAEQIFLVIDQRGLFVLGCAHGNHQWNEVVFLGMGLARSRRRIPLEQARYPLSRTALNERCLQPGIEALRRLLRTRSELPQVVVTQAAADDQYALFAQRRERAARR